MSAWLDLYSKYFCSQSVTNKISNNVQIEKVHIKSMINHACKIKSVSYINQKLFTKSHLGSHNTYLIGNKTVARHARM